MHLNFFKIDLPFSEFQIQEAPYTEESFQSLKAQFNKKASFFRYGNSIFVSPSVGFDNELGALQTVKVEEHPEIVRSLIRHMIFRAFRDDENTKGLLPESFSPLVFHSRKNSHDPIREFLPTNLQSSIQYPRTHQVHVRSIYSNGEYQFGLVIKGRHTWRLARNLRDVIDDGYDIVGKTVIESIPREGLENVLTDDDVVLGQVESHDDRTASILTNKGTAKRDLDTLYLQKTHVQIKGYLEAKIGKQKTNAVFSAVKNSREKSQSDEFSEIAALARWFSSKEYRNNDGFCFSVTTQPAVDCSGIQLESTNLVFDISPGASKPGVLAGLKTHGPFDSSRYPNKKFRILAVFHRRNHGAATSFIGSLVNGLPDSRYFQQGLKDLFRLHEVELVMKQTTASFAEDYEQAIDKAVQENAEDGFHVALVECPEGCEKLPIKANPYYRAKARLMSYGIPVQGVKESHLRKTSTQLAYTLGPVALQIYAKSGGIPWILPSSQSTDAELVIGIGNSIFRKNSWTGVDQSRVVGLTTFFNGDGRYLLGHESRTVPYSEYFEELLNSMKRSLSAIAEEYGWKKGQTVRLVFHVFKPLKNTEIAVVEQLVSELGYDVIYAFVTISKKHPWMLLSSLSITKNECFAGEAKRGDTFIIDQNSCLVQLQGDKDRPNRRQSLPDPVLIKIHEKSTYRDLPYITQQVLDFSFLNWRSFYPGELPAPIFYSDLMAGLSQKLSKIDGWNPTMLDKHFRRKTWFL